MEEREREGVQKEQICFCKIIQREKDEESELSKGKERGREKATEKKRIKEEQIIAQNNIKKNT